jgi:hypothetical protein
MFDGRGTGRGAGRGAGLLRAGSPVSALRGTGLGGCGFRRRRAFSSAAALWFARVPIAGMA